VAAATNAKNTMQGFPFFEKPIVSGPALRQQQQLRLLNMGRRAKQLRAGTKRNDVA
jgi:hypothetical protein